MRVLPAFLLLISIAPMVAAQASPSLIETPSLLPAVAAGELPPIEQRLPRDVQVVSLAGDKTTGVHGGELRMLMGKQKDIRQLVIYGYARLVGYNEALELQPDLLRDYEVVDGRVFTLHLRKGHRWSDGHPFTSEDFRYYWEDVANNPELSKSGPPRILLVDGQPPTVEYPDAHTVRYSWHAPNPYFLNSMANAVPLWIYRPSHYLKQFHARYQDPAVLDQMVKDENKRNWMSIHYFRDRPYRSTNPDRPTLQPWKNSTFPPAERFIFERNPYYHRIDQEGRQLPYVDRVAINIASSGLVPAKTGAGEADLQGRYLRMDNFTFLKSTAKRNGFDVRLWKTAKGAHLALYPNLNTNDPEYRRLLRDVRFRRALSVAIHRYEINQVVYFRLVQESNNTVLAESPLFRPEYQGDWTQFDLAQANRLLDELGLVERDDRGVRLLPDGRPLEIVVQTAGESTEQTDVLELIHDSWLQVGIKLYTVPSTREVFRNRIFSGDAVMSIWSGLENGLMNADNSPADLAPTTKYQYQWPMWGNYYETGGQAGEAPELPEVKRLVALVEQWGRATTRGEREYTWHQMLDIHRDQLFTIGIVNRVLHPVVVNDHLHNVPEVGFFDISPGAYFGIYKPDTFWFDEARR